MGWRGMGKSKIEDGNGNRGALDELSYAQAKITFSRIRH